MDCFHPLKVSLIWPRPARPAAGPRDSRAAARRLGEPTDGLRAQPDRPSATTPRPSASPPPRPSAAGGPSCLRSLATRPRPLPPGSLGPAASLGSPGPSPSPVPPAGLRPGSFAPAPPGRVIVGSGKCAATAGGESPGLCGPGCSFACEWRSLVNPGASAGARRRRRRKGGRSQLGVNEVGKESFREACKQPPSPGNQLPVPNPTRIDLNPGDKCFKLISLNKNEAKQNSLKSY